MVIALDPLAPYDYICKADRELPVEERTTFQLCRLSAREAARLDDAQLRGRPADGGVEVEVHQAQHRLKVLDAGLVGWENLRNAAGVEIQFREIGKFGAQGRRILASSVDALPADILRELSSEIQTSASLTEEQAGN